MSEEYFYNRSRNIQGVSDIDLTNQAPSYGMTVKFNAENKTMDFTDGYFKKTPYGLNSLKAFFNFSYEASHDNVQRIANNLEKLNSKVGFANSTKRVLGQNKIYKNIQGFIDEYSINHQNKNRYELSASLRVQESPNLLNWKTSSFLNVDVKTWQEGVEFEKDDIVYLPTDTSTTTNFRLGNIFYCKKDHKSSLLRNPSYGRDAKSFWTQDFEWQPDEKFETSLGFNSEKFGNKFKTRRKEENFVNLDIKYLFSSIGDKQALAILHFLETRAGYRRFRYRIPSVYNRPKIFISESWEHKWNYYNNHTISIDLIEDKLGVIPKEKEDNYYVQSSFYKKKFDVDYLPDSERFGFYDGSRNWYDYYAFFSDFDDQSSNPDNFYVPPVTQLIFDPGGINSGVFEVDTKTYIGASVEQTISTDIPDNWKLGNASIDEVSIGTSCTNIGSSAFYGTSLDQQLFIPPTVTGIKPQAFRECNGITGDLFIPPSVVEIGEQSFYKPFGLTDGNIFISDDSLKEPVTTIGSLAFYEAKNFSGNLIIGAGVKTIGERAFQYLGNSVGQAGRLEVGECTEIIGNRAFERAKFTGPLIIEDSVKSIGDNAFGYCTEFQSLYLGNSLETIGDGAFQWTEFYGDLFIPYSVKTIGQFSFLNCDNFDSINIESGSLETVAPSAFVSCDGFKSGILDFGNYCSSIGAYAFNGWSSFDGKLIFPTNENYTEIEQRTFFGWENFTSDLEIPSNVKIIKEKAFQSMGQLTTCGELKFNEGLERIDSFAFDNTHFLGNIILPDSVTGVDDNAFSNSLFDGYIKFSSNMKTISRAVFLNNLSLTGPIDIPNGVTTIEQQAFLSCNSLSGPITIPDSVETIGSYAFYNLFACVSDLYIPDKVTIIEGRTFMGGSNFKSLRLSPYTTVIRSSAFKSCFKIKGLLEIPSTIVSIETDAFRDCSSVSRINIRAATAPIVGSQAFGGMTSVTPAVIHVPVGAVGYAPSYDGLTVVYDL